MKNTMTLGLCILGGALSGWAASGQMRVQTARVTTCQSVLEKNIPGRVVAAAQVDVVSSVEGIVLEVAARAGTMVKEGDLLCRVDETRYRAKLQSAEARVEGCTIKLASAQTTYDRMKESRGVSAEKVDNAKSAVDAANAAKKEESAKLRLAQADLAACRIVAPISGFVDSIAKTVGDHVNGGAVVASVVKRSPIMVCFSLSNSDFLRMFGGLDAVVCSNAVVRLTLSDGSPFPEEGVVESVRGVIDERTDSLQFIAQFPNASGVLRSGGFVSVTLTDRRQITRRAVPASAVAWDEDGAYVWVVDLSGVVSRRGVKCGRLEGANRHVMEGLEAGEVVVAGGVHRLKSGMKVDIVGEATGQ